MAGSTYTIQLKVAGEDKALGDIAKITNALGDASAQARAMDFAGASKSAKIAADTVAELAKGTDDASKQMQEFSAISKKAYSDLAAQAGVLQYSLSEEGKERRKILASLIEERKALGDSKEEKKKAKELDKQIASLRARVADMSDDELNAALKENRAARERLKIAQNQAKVYMAGRKAETTFLGMVKKEWAGRLDAVKKYINALGTVEGKYKAIKKAGAAIGKVGAKAAIGIGAGALGLAGAAVASADKQVEAEREAARMRIPGTIDEKRAILGRLYVETGAGYAEIVDAVNRVRTAIKTTNPTLIEKAAVAEIKFPGGAALFRQQSAGPAGGIGGALNFARYGAVASALQSATGASRAQIEASAGKIANMRERSFSNASQTELQAVYLGLQNSGAFDDQGELDRAFARFVRAQSQGKEGVFELAQKWDWGKGAQGKQNKTQARNAAGLIDWAALESAANTTSAPRQTEAERTAQELRRIEEMKNKVLIKILKGLEPFFAKIDAQDIEKFADKFTELVVKYIPKIADGISAMLEFLGLFPERAEKAAEAASEAMGVKPSGVNMAFARFKADGGIATMPSICGEAGPEAVIPLAHERAGRASNIVQNLTQYFSMGESETTARSLAGAMAGTAWGTDGARRLARRMGR
jgi:hypothetical protein